MNFEPPVVERIRSEKRKALLQALLSRVPPALGIAACVSVIALRLARKGSSIWEALPPVNGALLAVALLAFLLLLGSFILWVKRLKKIGGEVLERISYVGNTAESAPLKAFGDALEAVAIGAGVPTPGLLVAGLPTVNALPVCRDGKDYVAVTERALEGELSFAEREAVMSYALSEAVLGHVWNTPVVLRSGVVPFFLLGMLAFLVVMTLIVLVPGETPYLVAVFLAAWAVVASLGPIGKRLWKRGEIAAAHGSALADSIAVKTTGDPSTLKSLLGKLGLEAEAETEELTPELMYVSRYLFACPRWKGNRAAGSLPEGREPEDSSQVRETARRRLARKVLDFGSLCKAVRLENLEAIERGHWRAFE